MTFEMFKEKISLYITDFINEKSNRSFQKVASSVNCSKSYIVKVSKKEIGPQADFHCLTKLIDVVVPENEREEMQKAIASFLLMDIPENLLKFLTHAALEKQVI